MGETATSTSVPAAQTGYASFTRRFRALVIDEAVLAAGLVALSVVSELTGPLAEVGPLVRIALLALLFLYEPLLVSMRGATIGHAAMNLRVVGPSGGNPSFARAVARYVVKCALGLPSFISLTATSRHQALHDVVTRTTVQIRNLSRASSDDYYEDVPASTAIDDQVEEPVGPASSADQLLALSRLDEQLRAIQARGLPMGKALAAYNAQRDAILSGELTSADIDAPD